MAPMRCAPPSLRRAVAGINCQGATNVWKQASYQANAVAVNLPGDESHFLHPGWELASVAATPALPARAAEERH